MREAVVANVRFQVRELEKNPVVSGRWKAGSCGWSARFTKSAAMSTTFWKAIENRHTKAAREYSRAAFTFFLRAFKRVKTHFDRLLRFQ